MRDQYVSVLLSPASYYLRGSFICISFTRGHDSFVKPDMIYDLNSCVLYCLQNIAPGLSAEACAI